MRLNKIYKENLGESEILSELESLFGAFKAEGAKDETFGDFTYRKYIVPKYALAE